jgi:hypothetical protein
MRAKGLNWDGHLVSVFDNRITKEIWKEGSWKEVPLKSRGKDGQVKCRRLPANCSTRTIGAQRKDIGRSDRRRKIDVTMANERAKEPEEDE